MTGVKEFTLVQSKDKIIWVVLGVRDKQFVCRPKYYPDMNGRVLVDGIKFSRLFSPIFNKGLNIDFISCEYKKVDGGNVFNNLYLIPSSLIFNIYHSNLNLEMKTRTDTARFGAALAKEISEKSGILNENIGFTGSLTLGCETDGYSDIDVVICGSDNYIKYCEAISAGKINNITFRNEEEWSEFFNKFNVQSVIDKKEFTRISSEKFDQGFYKGIPLTIFTVRKKLREMPVINETPSDASISGRIVDVSEKYYYPSIIEVQDKNKIFTVEIWDRAYKGMFKYGDMISVFGKLFENRMFVIPKHGYIITPAS